MCPLLVTVGASLSGLQKPDPMSWVRFPGSLFFVASSGRCSKVDDSDPRPRSLVTFCIPWGCETPLIFRGQASLLLHSLCVVMTLALAQEKWEWIPWKHH